MYVFVTVPCCVDTHFIHVHVYTINLSNHTKIGRFRMSEVILFQYSLESMISDSKIRLPEVCLISYCTYIYDDDTSFIVATRNTCTLIYVVSTWRTSSHLGYFCFGQMLLTHSKLTQMQDFLWKNLSIMYTVTAWFVLCSYIPYWSLQTRSLILLNITCNKQ